MNLIKYTSIILFSLLVCTNIQAQESGPAFIAATLEADSVYYAPTYELNNEYEDYATAENIQGLWMDGLDYEGHETKVWCWYGVPTTLAVGEKAPAVVLVHGGGGTAFSAWVKQWTDRGYIAIAMAHEGQMPGEKIDGWYYTWDYSGPRRAGFYKDADKEVGEQWFYHAIADAMMANSLLRSFPEVDTTQIGINGVSWGGVLTNVITGIDQRFDFSIPVYGCGFLWDSPKYGVDMATNSQTELDFYYANWDPSLYVPLQDLPVLYVNGNQDKQFAMNIATKTYDLIPSEKYLCVKNPLQHSTATAYSTLEVYEFADYITQGTTAPLTVTIDTITDSTQVTASYVGSALSAVVCYTTDTAEWIQGEIVWLEKAATVNSDLSQITAELSEGTQCFFINVTTAGGFIFSSPMKHSPLTSIMAPVLEPSSTVALIATPDTDYGTDKVATLISEVQIASDSLATFQISCDITPLPGTGIMSGSGGGTSVSTDWGVNTSEATAILNVLFYGNNSDELGAIGNLKVVNFESNGGDLTVDVFKSIYFQSVAIINGQSGGKDAVSVSVNGGDFSDLGNLSLSADTLDLYDLAEEVMVTEFALACGVSGSPTKNKWSVGQISVGFEYNELQEIPSVIPVNKQKELLISPNPASSSFAINIHVMDMQIYDISGKSVKQYPAGMMNFDISDLRSGIYFVKVNTVDGDVFTERLMKK